MLELNFALGIRIMSSVRGNKVGKILAQDLADEIKREVTRKCRREREM